MKKILTTCALLILAGCGGAERDDKDVVIDESALSTYSPEQYPKTYRAWGEAGVERIKTAERGALWKAAKQHKCDRVEYVGFSEKFSRPPSEIVVFADCANRWRFYINQDSKILSDEKTK